MKKTLGRTFITLSSLQTIIVEIEAHLNNRPLTYVSSESNDPDPLTPSHILYRRMINEDFQKVGTKLLNTLNKKAKTQALLIQYFWNRWKKEYSTSLRETHTTNNGSNKEYIRVGDVCAWLNKGPFNK